MRPQLRGRLAVFGDIVNAHEVLGLARIAFRPHTVALEKSVRRVETIRRICCAPSTSASDSSRKRLR